MLNIPKVIKESFDLYMPQVESEITSLASCVYNNIQSDEYPILVEIGTKHGGTFNIWCSINPTGLNVSIDYPDGGIHGGISKAEIEKRNQYFKSKYNNYQFIEGDSHDVKTEHQLQYHIGMNSIDFLFIDGDHSYEGVKQDFEMYSLYVRSGGLIAFHDINDSEKHRDRNVFVGKFWQEIKDSYKHFELNTGLDWAGIGVIMM